MRRRRIETAAEVTPHTSTKGEQTRVARKRSEAGVKQAVPKIRIFLSPMGIVGFRSIRGVITCNNCLTRYGAVASTGRAGKHERFLYQTQGEEQVDVVCSVCGGGFNHDRKLLEKPWWLKD